ncbi:MAG: thioredoxin domain-containing protein [Acidimicrobiales bacterium]
MTRVLVFVALVGAALAIAVILQRRRGVDAPTQPRYTVPTQLDRSEFDSPGAPWLVAVFTSTTCGSCADTWDKARQLESDTVAVQEIEAVAHRTIHQRYAIDAVPTVVVADTHGVVRASFLGSPTAADLWATLAELRAPGSTPPACDHHGSAPAG